MLPAARHAQRLLLAVGVLAAAWPLAAQPLPWQPDYAAAVARAQADQRHLVVLLAAPNDEACRRLETETLRAPLIREALADLVWVRVENDAELAARLGATERPSLVFVDPFTDDVLHRVGGERSVELLAREIVHARRAIGLELPAALDEVATRMYAFDEQRAEDLLGAGDAAGLETLLAPAADDDARLDNYLVATLKLPTGMVPDDVRFLAGTDCLIGGVATAHAAAGGGGAARPPELAGSCEEFPIEASGLVFVPFPRENGAELAVRITAPGCRLIDDTVRFAGPPPGTAVQVRRYELVRLSAAAAAQLCGRVERPDGAAAAAAIVRIDGWFDTSPAADHAPVPAVTRTDDDGRFTFRGVSPGRWLVRAESPGGEREAFVELEPGGRADCRIGLEAVTTVGLRWVLQTRALSQELSGVGSREAAAFFSVASSRIELARGMRLRVGDACDLALAQTPIDDASLSAETRDLLADLPDGTPVWYLVDAAYTATFLPLSGLHRDPRPFAAISTVCEDEPLAAEEWAIVGPILPQALAATREQGSHFQLLRGVPVRQGDVFTLRCAASNCFAKLEVTDVTIVTPKSRRGP